jgi:hypothetical protein
MKAPLPERPPVPPPAPPTNTSTSARSDQPPRPPHDHQRNPSVGSVSQGVAASTDMQTRRPSVPVTDTVDMQTPDKKPEVDLPPGWMTVWSKSQNRWYFFCTKSNKSVWQWPPP